MAKTANTGAAAAQEAAASGVMQAASTGFEQTLAHLKEGVAQATGNFETTQAKVKENMDKVFKSAEEAFAFGQGNLDAVMKSGQIWATGVQELGKQVAATAQANFDASVAAFKAMGGVKTIGEALEVQTNLARASFEKASTETTKLTSASMTLAEQAFAPIAARLNLAAEKFAKPV